MAESKKKIIIKKKTVIKKPTVVKSAKKSTEEDVPQSSSTPKIQAPAGKKVKVSKKVQVSKKTAVKKPSKEAPPPEVVSTSEIESDPPQAERQKTMISKPPIGASSHENEPKAKKEEEAFKFYCIRCGQKLEAYYDWVGRSISCPRCQASIKIPEPLS